MKDYIMQRVLGEAEYILETGATVRQTAKKFMISKSTVHKDMTERLVTMNKQMASDVGKVLEKNKSERHIRGGMATRQKYSSNKRR